MLEEEDENRGQIQSDAWTRFDLDKLTSSRPSATLDCTMSRTIAKIDREYESGSDPACCWVDLGRGWRANSGRARELGIGLEVDLQRRSGEA